MRVATFAVLTLATLTSSTVKSQAQATLPSNQLVPPSDSMQSAEADLAPTTQLITPTSHPEISALYQESSLSNPPMPDRTETTPLTTPNWGSLAQQPEMVTQPEFTHELDPGFYALPNDSVAIAPPAQADKANVEAADPDSAPSIRADRSNTDPTLAPLVTQSIPVTVTAQRRRPNRIYRTSQRRARLQLPASARVTNRTNRAIEIELVGHTRPIVLLPGESRTLRGGRRDFSLLYWTPIRPGQTTQVLQAQVAQVSGNSLLVDIFPSSFPSNTQAIYYPEPGGSDVLKIF